MTSSGARYPCPAGHRLQCAPCCRGRRNHLPALGTAWKTPAGNTTADLCGVAILLRLPAGDLPGRLAQLRIRRREHPRRQRSARVVVPRHRDGCAHASQQAKKVVEDRRRPARFELGQPVA